MIPNKPALGLDPRVDTGFRKRSCSTNKLEQDDDSKKSHPALGTLGRQKASLFPSDCGPALKVARRPGTIDARDQAYLRRSYNEEKEAEYG
jgi:hypothetical protein